MSKATLLTEMIKSRQEMEIVQNSISEQEEEIPTIVLDFVERERLFIQKQKLVAESNNLLEEFINLSLSLNFSKADKIKERIDFINKEIQRYNEAFDSLDII